MINAVKMEYLKLSKKICNSFGAKVFLLFYIIVYLFFLGQWTSRIGRTSQDSIDFLSAAWAMHGMFFGSFFNIILGTTLLGNEYVNRNMGNMLFYMGKRKMIGAKIIMIALTQLIAILVVSVLAFIEILWTGHTFEIEDIVQYKILIQFCLVWISCVGTSLFAMMLTILVQKEVIVNLICIFIMFSSYIVPSSMAMKIMYVMPSIYLTNCMKNIFHGVEKYGVNLGTMKGWTSMQGLLVFCCFMLIYVIGMLTVLDRKEVQL